MYATIMEHRERSNPNFTRVMDSELAVVTQEQDTGLAITTFVKTSAQLSGVGKMLGIRKE